MKIHFNLIYHLSQFIFLRPPRYDRYRGNVIVLFVKDGHIRPSDQIQFVHTGLQYQVKSVGVLLPQEHPTDQL